MWSLIGVVACATPTRHGPQEPSAGGRGGSGNGGNGGSAGDDAAGAGGDGTVSASPGCAAFNRAYCARLADCYGLVPGDTLEGCERYYAPTCVWTTLPGVVSGDAELRACIPRIASTDCSELVICDFGAGTLENGSACGSDHQCESGYCTSNFITCGRCEARPSYPEVGDACADAIADCGVQLNCVDHRCAPPGDEGDACDPETPCSGGPRTDGFLQCLAGECTLLGGEGEPCFEGGAGAPECGNGLECTALGRCVRTEAASAGETCGRFEDRVIVCPDGACVSDAAATETSRCVDWAGSGEACDKVPGYFRCAVGMECDANFRCAWPPPLIPAVDCGSP